jgi:hypothetical protein
MAGNEIEIARFLLDNRGKVILKHLGLIKTVGAPSAGRGFTVVNSAVELRLISTQAAGKKADIYINGIGVSLKQAGASFSFNRLQRAELLELLRTVGFADPAAKILRIDKEVDDFHNGLLEGRNRPWQSLFDENEFKSLIKFLMMESSPNLGKSTHPAELILEAPRIGISQQNIRVFTFDEYFDIFKQNLFVALRRQWIGQSSNSEHRRATGLAKKPGNAPWVYGSIAGTPGISKTTGKRWRDEVEEADRKTVYIIFIEKAGK